MLRKSAFITNFFHFSLLRLFNIATKFFLLAYLIRVFGENNYGLLTWSDSVLQYFVVVINFGFNIYGAKYIVKYLHKKQLLNNIISSIYLIKGFFLVSSFFLLFLISLFPLESINFRILFLLLLSTFGDALLPIWYFQGIEKIKPITKIVGLTRLLLIAGTFLFVKSNADFYLYIYFFSACQVLTGILGYISLKNEAYFTFVFPKKKILKNILSKASFYFFGNLSMLVFNALTIFLIGIFVSYDKVAAFDVSIKLVLVTLLPFEIVQAVMLPRITKTKNKKLLKRIVLISFLCGFFLFVFLNAFPETLMGFLGGKEMTKFSYVLKVLSFITLTVPATFILGQCGLVAFGKDKAYNFSLILVSLSFLAIVLLLYVFNQLNFNNLVYLRVFSDYLLLALIVYQLFKKKIFNAPFLRKL